MTGATRTLVVDRIGLLVTNDPEVGDGPLGLLRDASVVVADGRVVSVGGAGAIADDRIDADGACVMPGFVDSHSHLVFAGDRSAEFAARMAGAPYAAGGIRTTVEATRAASDDALVRLARNRRREALRSGTTTIEIKSGYGLTVVDEARQLRLARMITAETTFLGAHVVPAEYEGRADAYVELVSGPMLDAAVTAGARWVDAFCEVGAFDAEHCRQVLGAGAAAGLGLRLHANQLGHGPGVRLGVELGCASVDHCTYLDDDDIDALAGSATVATFLPVTDFSTRQPYPDARRVIEAGATVALGVNCNPGSSYSTSMPLCIALAVRELRMTTDEAIHAATWGGARALRRDDVGRLTPGTRADMLVLAAPSYDYFAYRPGVPIVRAVIHDGIVSAGDAAPD